MVDLDKSKYKHVFPIRVRNYEVDSQGIVHNAIYLEYCEVARIEYARSLGFAILLRGRSREDLKINVRRNEINYEAPARVDELIEVCTRISYIKNSSFCFEHLIFNSETGLLLVTQKSVQVNLDTATHKPKRLPDSIRKVILDFEGSDVQLIQ